MFSRRGLVALIVPLVIAQVLNSLMGLADTFMVSAVSDAAISGVSCVDTVNLLMIFIFEAVATGGNVVCSQYLGKRDEAGAANASLTLMLAVLMSSIAVSVPFALSSEPILHLIFGSVEADVMLNATTYLKITAISYPFMALYSASSALYCAAGDTKLPVTVVAIGNAMNVIGNAALIFGLGMGVAGAAVATLASRIFCCLAMLFFQFRTDLPISLGGMLSVRPDFSVLRSIARIGVPVAVENGMFQLGKIIVQSTVATLGTTVIAAQAVVAQIEVFALRPSVAIGTALLTVAGQCMGAGRPEEARRYAIRLTAVSQASCLLLSALTLAVTPALCSLTKLDAEGVTLVWQLMIFICTTRVLFWPEAFTLPNCLRAAGDVSFPMGVSIASMWVFRVLFSYIICRVTPLGLWGVWLGWILDWLVRAIVFTIRFARGKWMRMELLGRAETAPQPF